MPGPCSCCTLLKLTCLAVAVPWQVVAITNQVTYPPLDDVWTFLAYDIGLSPKATVSISLTNDRPANNTYVMMLTHAQWEEWHRVEPTTLPGVDGQSMGGLNSYLASYWRKGIVDRLEASFTIDAPRDDRYYIGVLNAQQQQLKLQGSWSMVNPGGDQLILQEEKLPPVLLAMSILFSVSCAAFVGLLFSVWRNGRTAMHALMVLVILFKAVVLLLQWGDRILVSRTGTDTVVGDVSYQLLDKVQTILELMMFLLTSLGWKFLRNSLNVTEVRVAVGISVISFYLGVFEVACTTASTCSGYKLSRYILHSLCYLIVIVAMNFNLQMVLHQISDAPANLEAGKLYQKHLAYKIFRWIFLIFIIAPTVELFLKVSMMPWDAIWAYILLEQLRTWAIYVCIIIAFRPDPRPLRVFELTRRVAGSDDDDDSEGHGADEEDGNE